jgi:hypothetical protein
MSRNEAVTAFDLAKSRLYNKTLSRAEYSKVVEESDAAWTELLRAANDIGQ